MELVGREMIKDGARPEDGKDGRFKIHKSNAALVIHLAPCPNIWLYHVIYHMNLVTCSIPRDCNVPWLLVHGASSLNLTYVVSKRQSWS